MEFTNKHRAMLLGSTALIATLSSVTLAEWWQNGTLQYYSHKQTICDGTPQAHEGGAALQITFKQHQLLWVSCD